MEDWKFGPEYTYNLTMNYAIKTDTHDLVTNMRLASTVKCRPKDSEILFCRLQNSTTMVSTLLMDRNMTREIETAKTFAIKFNERGVESLLMETPFPIQVVTIVRKIANQLSVGVDLNERKISMSQFIARENTSMGDCATRYRIERKESQSNDKDKDNEWIATTGYWTRVLSMTDARPSETVLIEKSRMGCVNTPRYLDYATGILKMVKNNLRLRFAEPKKQINFLIFLRHTCTRSTKFFVFFTGKILQQDTGRRSIRNIHRDRRKSETC